MAIVVEIKDGVCMVDSGNGNITQVPLNQARGNVAPGIEVNLYNVDGMPVIEPVVQQPQAQAPQFDPNQAQQFAQGQQFAPGQAPQFDPNQAPQFAQGQPFQQPQGQQQVNVIIQQPQRPCNKVIYLLLCFFLGGFGAHKFYAGKTLLGVLYLVFCWTLIPGLIALIEFIIGLFKPVDSQGNIIF